MINIGNHHGVIFGVDVHMDEHVAVAINRLGIGLGEFHLTTAQGYEALKRWAMNMGGVIAFGVEGMGYYGAGLSRFLIGQGYYVIEVNRPDGSTPQAAYSPCESSYSNINPGSHQSVAMIKTRYILRCLTDPNLLQSVQHQLKKPAVYSVCADSMCLMQYLHIEVLSERSKDMIMTLNCSVCAAYSHLRCPLKYPTYTACSPRAAMKYGNPQRSFF